jgi:tetratricopeptide (TPR) repeat protein
MINNLQKIKELIKNGKLIESLKSINNTPNHEKNFDLISLKAYIYLNLKKFKKSYDCYSVAININKNSFICFNLRATASFELGNFADSIKDFKEALLINNKFYEPYENIGKCYSNLGKNKEAIKYYELALEHSPNNNRLIEMISEKLTELTTPLNTESKISKINSAIKNLEYEYTLNSTINNGLIKRIINEAEILINKNFENLCFSQTQIFRKNSLNLNCDRHFLIFRNFKIIPEYCFSCIKVTINLSNVIELIKLFLIFDNIVLPNNNLRKCMIDLRKNSKANYKGFIYCRSIEEAEIVRKKINQLLKIKISEKLSANIKRGCSAFNDLYPGYEDPKNNQVNYNSDWKKHEKDIDEKFTKFQSIRKIQETTKGISFYDIMIIKNWLFFAKLTNDESYKKIIMNININPNLKKIIEQNKLNIKN